MEELKTKAGELTDSISEYIQTYYKLSLIKLTDKATGLAASVVAFTATLILGIFILLFSSIALGMWLGSLVNNAPLGYLLVAALYLLILVIIIALRKKVVFPMIRNNIINKVYEPDDQDI